MTYLTNHAVINAKPKVGQKRTKFFDGNQLYLWVMPTGSKTFYHEYKFEGKRYELRLGGFPGISLKEARLKRDENRLLLAKGVNPKSISKKTVTTDDEVTKNLEKGKTFAEVFEEVCKERTSADPGQKPLWSSRTLKGHLSRFNAHVLPQIGKMQISEIGELDLINILIGQKNQGNYENQKKIYTAFHIIFDYAVLKRYIKNNVGRYIPSTLVVHKKSNNYKNAQTPYELSDVLKKIHNISRASYIVKSALLLQSMVFLRPSELVGLRWSYIDFEKNLIEIPARDMKMNKPHLVPISSQAKDLLLELHEYSGQGEYVFPSSRNPGNHIVPDSLGRALKNNGIIEINPHGFRHTASTFLNEHKWDRDAIEIQLSHIIKGVRGVYNKSQQLVYRTEMMQAWSNFLEEVLKSPVENLLYLQIK